MKNIIHHFTKFYVENVKYIIISTLLFITYYLILYKKYDEGYYFNKIHFLQKLI